MPSAKLILTVASVLSMALAIETIMLGPANSKGSCVDTTQPACNEVQDSPCNANSGLTGCLNPTGTTVGTKDVCQSIDSAANGYTKCVDEGQLPCYLSFDCQWTGHVCVPDTTTNKEHDADYQAADPKSAPCCGA